MVDEKTVTIVMTEAEAQVAVKALDLYASLETGQFEEFAEFLHRRSARMGLPFMSVALQRFVLKSLECLKFALDGSEPAAHVSLDSPVCSEEAKIVTSLLARVRKTFLQR